MLENPRFRLYEQLRASALDHVAQQRPGGSAETNQWYTARQLLSCESNRLVYIVQRLFHIDLTFHHLLVLLVVGSLQWLWEMRALLVNHDYLHTHRLRNYKDVREYDRSINKASKPIDGLEGKRGGDFGRAAAFEEVILSFYFVVFGEVSSGFLRCEQEPFQSD